jgi:hypothetical protein
MTVASTSTDLAKHDAKMPTGIVTNTTALNNFDLTIRTIRQNLPLLELTSTLDNSNLKGVASFVTFVAHGIQIQARA